MRPFALAIATLFGCCLGAQSTLPQNRLDFSNWYLQAQPIAFPNYHNPGGNVAGDGMFKVFPAEVFEQDRDIQITGFHFSYEVDASFPMTFVRQVNLPAVQFYRTQLLVSGGQTYETIDFSQPVGPEYAPNRDFPATNLVALYDKHFGAPLALPPFDQALVMPSRVNGQRTGVAIFLKATPGDLPTALRPTIQLESSFDERHIAPGHPSYSGTFNAATQVLAQFGQSGQPSATGELAVGLYLGTPTLQVYGSAAGGFNDPQHFETHLGPGAYSNDLATTSGTIGLFVQAQPRSATSLVWPLLVSRGIAGPTTSLGLPLGAPIPTSALRYTPGQVAQLLPPAPIGDYQPGGFAGFREVQTSAYASPPVFFPAAPVLVGLDFWMQAVIVAPGFVPADATNAVRVTCR